MYSFLLSSPFNPSHFFNSPSEVHRLPSSFSPRSVGSSTVSPRPFDALLGRQTSGTRRCPVRPTVTSTPSLCRWKSKRMMARATSGTCFVNTDSCRSILFTLQYKCVFSISYVSFLLHEKQPFMEEPSFFIIYVVLYHLSITKMLFRNVCSIVNLLLK